MTSSLNVYVVSAYALSLAAACYASTQTFAISRMVKSVRLRSLWLVITFGSGLVEVLHGGTTVYLALIPDNSVFTSSAMMLLAAGGIFACMAVLMRQSMDSVLRIPALEKLAFCDALTGVPNRRAFDQAIGAAAERAPVTMFLIDIDHFKKVNDTYGHDVGDVVLKHVARMIERSSAGHTVYRLGGEEFGFFTPAIPGEARKIADACRSAVEQAPWLHAGTPLTATISVGISTQEAGETTLSLLRRADVALYDAKRAGRNRVVEATGRDEHVRKATWPMDQSLVSRRRYRTQTG